MNNSNYTEPQFFFTPQLTLTQLMAILMQNYNSQSKNPKPSPTPNPQNNTLSTAQVIALSPSQVASLTSAQVSALTISDMKVLTTLQISAFKSSQISSFSTAQLHALSNNQIAAFTSEDFAAMSNAQLNVVVDANPISSAGYYTDSLPLFSAKGPSIDDVNQQGIGDCYLLAGLAGLAKNYPGFIQSMIKNDGNGIYSVRFFNNGQADWVTINNQVAKNGADSTVDSWVAIVEKAYVEFKSIYLGAVNNYDSINGGWSNGLQAVTGNTVTNYYGWSVDSSTWLKDAMMVENDLSQGEVVMYASYQNSIGANGKTDLVAGHMLTVTGFDTATGEFILRNPWGSTYGAPSWNITFEESAQSLYGNGGNSSGAFIVDNSVGANGSAGQLTQAMAAISLPMVSGATVLANNLNVNQSTFLTVVH